MSDEPIDWTAPRGPKVKDYLAVQQEGTPTTTRQAEVLNTALIGSPGDERGVVIGSDAMSGAMVAHDPFTAYEGQRITSPNVCLLGEVGSGKSSLIKTVYVERPLMLRRRRALVLDKKMRNGEGEYAELTRTLGAEPFRFDPDDPRGSTCMNILDPVILRGGGPAAALGLLVAFAELSGDGALSTLEHGALRAAHHKLRADFEGRSRVPVIEDLLALLPGILKAEEFKGFRPSTLVAVDMAALEVRERMSRLLADDLAGMFDGETSKHVRLHPKLTTFDISALPEDGPATSMVMVVANAWLMGMLTHDRGWRTNFVAEEGWHLLGGPGGKVIRSKSKLSRGLGVSVVAAIHHISDIPPKSDAIAMIKEAQTIHLFRQGNEGDIADCVRYFNLERSNTEALRNLPQGEHLLKVGTHKEIRVAHVRTEREIGFTETDSAMLLNNAEVTE